MILATSDPYIGQQDYKITDKVFMPEVIVYITQKLEQYNTALLESIKLLPLHKKAALHGCCKYPVRSTPRARTFTKGYRIRASVNVEISPPISFNHWARIPSSDYKQGWYSGPKTFTYDDLEECAIHTLCHEIFHFLSHSKQVKIKNTEANANWWADQWLDEFRQLS
jgi:hypothetical protein